MTEAQIDIVVCITYAVGLGTGMLIMWLSMRAPNIRITATDSK